MSRAVLLATLTAAPALSAGERSAIQRLINGNLENASSNEPQLNRLLVTQKSVAALLSVSRVTVWRMTKNGILHPLKSYPVLGASVVGTFVGFGPPRFRMFGVFHENIPETATLS